MQTLDRLSSLLDRFTVRARRFHSGLLCETTPFEAIEGRGFLHILRSGTLTVTEGLQARPRVVTEPSVLFYPRPCEHTFTPVPGEGADLACATLEFDGGGDHPLVRGLPDVVTAPITQVAGLNGALDLLFDELDDFRCGHRHVADRLFEITLLKLLRWMLDHPEEAGLPPGLLTGLSDLRIVRALAAVHEDPGHLWTLQTLAQTARMSRSAFAARFREVMGTTAHDYTTGWRVTVGQQRLRQGQPITRVAADLGYTGSSFSRVFTQRTGCSPRAWLARAEVSGD